MIERCYAPVHDAQSEWADNPFQFARIRSMKTDTVFVEARRRLLASGGLAAIGTALVGLSHGANAQGQGIDPSGGKGIAGVAIAADRAGICATCQFWGGMRRVAEDGKSVLAESLGWCNNRASPSFQMMRSPEAGPMQAWRKWDAL